MNLKLAPLFISLALLSGNALADHVIKTLVPTEVRKSYDGLLVAMSATALDAPEERHDWTGLYVGGFVGGSAGTRANTNQPCSNGSCWKGSNGSDSYNTKANVMAGGTVGYNWQLGKSPYLVGIEGELGYLGSKGSSADPLSVASGDSPANSHKTKIGGTYGFVGSRVGYAYKNSLFFVKGGAVFVKTKSGYIDDCSASPCGSGLLRTSSSKTSVGYGIGGGIEQALPSEWFEQAKNISIKVEYLYLGVKRNQTSTGSCVGCEANVQSHSDGIRGIHTAKVGINYHFDGF